MLTSQEDVVLQLYGDGDLKRQMLLPKGEKEFEFKNVPAVNEKGEEIDFEIKEIANEDYEASIYFDEERALWIMENRSTVKPTKPPVKPSNPPAEPTEPPVEATEPPLKPSNPPVEAIKPSVKPPKLKENPKKEFDSLQEDELKIEFKEDEKLEMDTVQSLPQTGKGISPAIPFALSATFFGLLLYLKNKE